MHLMMHRVQKVTPLNVRRGKYELQCKLKLEFMIFWIDRHCI